MDLEHTITSFLLYVSGNMSLTTRDLYSWALSRLSAHLGNPELKSIKPDDLDSFWSWLRNDYVPTRMSGNTAPLSGRSLENIWTAQRSFFKWCVDTGRLKRRPDLHIRRPEYSETEVEPFTEDEVRRMILCAERTRIARTDGKRTPFTMPRNTARRDVAIIMLLAETGIRVSECARLARGDISFDKSEVTIQPYGTGRKTKYRKLEIGKATREALWEYIAWREHREHKPLADDDVVFISMRGNPMNKDSIRQVIEEIGLAAGVENAHPHRFRHFYTSVMAAEDVGEAELREKLGQTSGKMVRRYTHLHRVKRKKRISIVDVRIRGR